MTGTFEELINSQEPVLIDFTTEWCKPCKVVSAVLNKLVNEMEEDITVVKIDMDKNPALRKKYKIEAIPTLIIFKRGQQKWRHTGLISLPEIKKAMVGSF